MHASRRARLHCMSLGCWSFTKGEVTKLQTVGVRIRHCGVHPNSANINLTNVQRTKQTERREINKGLPLLPVN